MSQRPQPPAPERPLRIALIAYGTRGDVEPARALRAALGARGHDVRAGVPPNFVDRVARDAGPGPVGPVGRNSEILIRAQAVVADRPFREDLRVYREIFGEQVPEMLRDALAVAEGADIVVGIGAECVSRTVAEVLGTPHVEVCLFPHVHESDRYAPPGVEEQTAPRWVNRMSWRVYRTVLQMIFLRPLNAGRAALGLERLRDIVHELPAHRRLVAVDPLVSPAPDDWAVPYEATGFFFSDDGSAPIPTEVEAFLGAGAPPVYVGFGSMTTDDSSALAQAVLDGARAAGARVLLSGGWAGLGPADGAGGPGDDVLQIGEVSHAALFPRLAAVVHHGGAGTTATALRAGVPQVVVPHFADQFYWAHQLDRLGVAPPGVSALGAAADGIAAALRSALDGTPAERAAGIASQIIADGPARAARAIEDVSRLSQNG